MEYFVERLQKELEIDEGCKYETYLDHLGLPTFGIGHLVKETDQEHNKPIGTAVSKERVLECFEQDIRTTIMDCKKIFDDWEAMPEQVRLIMANMMFNLGLPRYSKFRKHIQAVMDGDWKESAHQMRDSRWHKQVPNRAERLCKRMEEINL